QILTQDPTRPAALRRGLDPKLEAICLKAMARKAADRFGSMQQLADALDTWLGRDTAPCLIRPPRPARSRRWPLIAAALAGVAALVLGIVLYVNTRPGTNEPPEVTPSRTEKQDGFRPLFNGKDLSGWKTGPKSPGNWRVEEGVLIGSGPSAGYL